MALLTHLLQKRTLCKYIWSFDLAQSDFSAETRMQETGFVILPLRLYGTKLSFGYMPVSHGI